MSLAHFTSNDKSLPSKQAVEGSNPFARSTLFDNQHIFNHNIKALVREPTAEVNTALAIY